MVPTKNFFENMEKKLLAQIQNPVLKGQLKTPTESTMGNILGSLIGVLVIVGAFFALFNLFQGGLQWITSGGDKQGLETARNKILQAIIGLVIVISIWAIANVILPWVGIEFPNITIPTLGE